MSKTKFNQIEKLGELHPPYMNFMGPKTKVEDRLSLNYKGRGGIKRGTENYFLPTTYSDLVSFEHDLLYYSPNNIVKAYADEKFIKDVRSLIGIIGITGQYVRRHGIEISVGVGSVKALINSIGKLYVNLKDIKGFLNKRSIFKKDTEKIITAIRTAATALRERNPNIESTADLPEDERWLLAALLAKKKEIMENAKKIRRGLFSTFFFNLLPSLLFTGAVIAPSIIKRTSQLYEQGTSLFIEDKEYTDLQKRVDKVKDKYVKYLNIVGDFEDTPSFKSLLKIFGRGEGEKVFKIKSQFDKDKAKNAYKDFYNEFLDYQNYMNDKYKNIEGYEPFDIKELNEENLNKVVEMKNVPSSFYEEIYQWYSSIDANQLTTGEQNELNTSIQNVLETPSPTPTEPTPTPTPTPMPIPIDLNFFKKFQEEETKKVLEETKKILKAKIEKVKEEEEIKKVLEKEIETPFETPIQLNVPTDADFFKSLQQQQQQI